MPASLSSLKSLVRSWGHLSPTSRMKQRLQGELGRLLEHEACPSEEARVPLCPRTAEGGLRSSPPAVELRLVKDNHGSHTRVDDARTTQSLSAADAEQAGCAESWRDPERAGANSWTAPVSRVAQESGRGR